ASRPEPRPTLPATFVSRPIDPPRPLLTGPAFVPLPDKEYIENSIGMRLVRIPAGRFKMGSPDSETERREDEIFHTVELTRPFWLGVHEVTQEQFEKV